MDEIRKESIKAGIKKIELWNEIISLVDDNVVYKEVIEENFPLTYPIYLSSPIPPLYVVYADSHGNVYVILKDEIPKWIHFYVIRDENDTGWKFVSSFLFYMFHVGWKKVDNRRRIYKAPEEEILKIYSELNELKNELKKKRRKLSEIPVRWGFSLKMFFYQEFDIFAGYEFKYGLLFVREEDYDRMTKIINELKKNEMIDLEFSIRQTRETSIRWFINYPKSEIVSIDKLKIGNLSCHHKIVNQIQNDWIKTQKAGERGNKIKANVNKTKTDKVERDRG